jgi:NADH-quinone oxidoreductase subunit L
MHTLALIVLAPLAGFLINGLLGRRLGERGVAIVGCALPLAAFVLTLQAFASLLASGAPVQEVAYTWAEFGARKLEIAFYLDRLSGVMTLVVTGVGTAIHVYSVGYMKGDESYARYFAYLNLFLFFMLLLVLGRSLLVLFVGWEGVGLASYLLIGFWFSDPEKAAAGKKAFIANRIGDAAFLIGMFALWATLGTLDLPTINETLARGVGAAVPVGLVALMLLIGATGKSAQIPLYVWLPDAMAGPTPVSALIHAATMVTAGVYLIARLPALYLAAPDVALLVSAVGAATALLAATIAVVQTDIKKVLAYSTISQLGLMFVALGVGAYAVAVFHVVTHAFFKACLFLGAGSVIHALSGEQDIRRMGGLARRIPITFATFAIATAAIAGLPPLAGFFSKDEILWFAAASPHGSWLLWAVASLASLLTAFYMFRLLWLVFFGSSRLTHEAEHHLHESPWIMTGVLVLLAALSAVGGFFPIPHFLEAQLPLPEVPQRLAHLQWPLIGVAVALALAGLAGAAWLYGGDGRRAQGMAARFPAAHRLVSAKFYIDEIYQALLMKPLLWISDWVFLRLGDRLLIDGSLDGLAGLARRSAGRLSRVQSGNLQWYVLFALAGIVGALLWIWRHV